MGGVGVDLAAGGVVANGAGMILGGQGGQGGFANSPNKGSGYYGYYGGHGGAGAAGVILKATGSVTNGTGVIAGGQGGAGGNGTTYNTVFGGDGGTGAAGVVLKSGGVVTNAGGTIAGGQGGVGGSAYYGGAGGAGGAGVMFAAYATLINTGMVMGGAAGGNGGPRRIFHRPGGAADGVDLVGGGLVINGSPTATTATITGVVGVSVGAGTTATVTNFGTIQGTGGTSVQFTSASDRLIVEAGSTFIGAVRGGGGTLELAGGAGTITGLGGTGTISGAAAIAFSGFGAYQIDAGSAWTLVGANIVAGPLSGAGSLTIAGGSTTFSAANAFTSGVTVQSGTLDLAAVGAGGTGAITFAGPATLQIDAAALPASGGTFANTIAHFGAGDSLDLAGLPFAKGPTATLLGSTLTVKSGTRTALFTLSSPATKYYAYGDGAGGVVVDTVAPVTAAWKTAVSGDWSVAADWSGGKAANSLQTSATIAVVGTYTVSVGTEESFLGQGVTLINATATLGLAGTLALDGTGLTLTAGTLQMDGGTLAGRATIATAGKVSGYGTIAGAVANSGTTTATGGTLLFGGPVTGAGLYTIAGGATLAFGGAVAAKTINFAAGGTETLKLSGALAAASSIAGFAAGDVIDMAGQSVTSDKFASGVLTLYSGTTVVDAFKVAGTYTGKIFALSSDGSGGTNVTLAADAAPAITVPGSQAAKAGTAIAIAGVSIADADAVVANQTITVTLTDKSGLLSATAAAGGTVTGAGTLKLVIAGTLDQVNGDLATLTYANATAASDSITVGAIDGVGGTALKKAIAVGVTMAPTPASSPVLFSQAMAALGGASSSALSAAPQAHSGALVSLLARGG